MTEEEAKTKICPTIRYCVNESGVVQDGYSAIYNQSTCIGSDCMAWRWMSPHHLEPGLIEDGVAIDSDGRVTKHGHRMGFCGLSGAPQ